MRQFSRRSRSSGRSRRLTAALAVGIVAGFGLTASAIGAVATAPVPPPVRAVRVATVTPTTVTPTTLTPTTLAPTTLAAVRTTPTTLTTAPTTPPITHVFATGNARLDALLATLPAVLFEGKATVHFGYNPIDCCHAGGYNPVPNDVWVSERALASDARLVYVTAHELGHSLHLHSARGAALTAAVSGAPVVRAGSPWDVSEKVADCIAWVLFPAQTAASGLTYWTCPDPWRAQVRAALA
jgi:hypothetical protein